MKKLYARELSTNQPILRFDVILQHDWLIEQYLLHIRVFFGGKTKRPCFDLFIHWLIKQIRNTYRNHFSRTYENRFIQKKKNTKKREHLLLSLRYFEDPLSINFDRNEIFYKLKSKSCCWGKSCMVGIGP